MVKKGKKRSTGHKVTITLRGDSARQIDSLLETGLYGRTPSGAAERVLMEGLLLRREGSDADFKVVGEVRGYAAYALRKYASQIGSKEEEVLGYIVLDWVSKNYSILSSAGISVNDSLWKDRPKKGRK